MEPFYPFTLTEFNLKIGLHKGNYCVKKCLQVETNKMKKNQDKKQQSRLFNLKIQKLYFNQKNIISLLLSNFC